MPSIGRGMPIVIDLLKMYTNDDLKQYEFIVIAVVTVFVTQDIQTSNIQASTRFFTIMTGI